MKIHQFMPIWGLASASPFCLKLQAYCRMAGVPYEVVDDLTPSGGPTGKLPYIETDDGRKIGDSGLIVEHLEAEAANPLDAWMNPAQKSQSLAYRRLIEESLYTSLLLLRWADPEGWSATKQAFFGDMAWPLRAVVPPLVRRGIVKAMDGHGRGRHDFATAYAMGMDDLSALSNALGVQAYFFGDRPATLDAAAFGMLAHIVTVPLDSAMKEHALRLGNLEPYCRRIQETYFPNEKSGA